MVISLIVAVDEAGVIGFQGRLPWHVSPDLKRFKQVTMGKPVIMGRKTFESIGKPLPGRQNIVLTHQSGFAAPGCTVVATPAAAIEAAGLVPEVMVIGGAGVFADFLPAAGRLYLTRVPGRHPGDVWLPPIDWSGWRLASSTAPPPESPGAPPPCVFEDYERIVRPAAGFTS